MPEKCNNCGGYIELIFCSQCGTRGVAGVQVKGGVLPSRIRYESNKKDSPL